MSYQPSRRTVIAGGVAAAASVAAGLTGLGQSRSAAATAAADLALTHVAVIDPTRTGPLPDMTVLISGDRIVAVGRHHQVRVPRGARVVDLTGRFLIPGLCEMHAHSFGTERVSPPLYVLHGVTTVREMSGAQVVIDWRRKVETGHLLGPRWTIAGAIIDGDPPLLVGEPGQTDGTIRVATEAQARAAVRRVKAAGADFVKPYSRLSPDAYRGLADEARRQRMTFAGHCPDAVPVTVASDAGQRSFEHLHAVFWSTARQDARVREALGRIRIEPGDYRGWFRQIHPIEWMASGQYSPRRAAEVFRRLSANHTWVTPTLAMHEILDKPEEASMTGDRFKYVPADTKQFWREAIEEIYKPGRTREDIIQQRILFHRRLDFVQAMHRAGVKILAGTDVGIPLAIPGISLHDELALLVQAGLSPRQALQAATIEPARYLGVEDLLGSIRPGKLADLVILDANPLADITNTTKIHSVLVRGRLITPAQRRRMLADVEQAATEPTGSMPAATGGCCHTRPTR